MDNNTIEMQSKVEAEGDKDASQPNSATAKDKPPDPPKRDYQAEGISMVSEPVTKGRKFGYFPRPEVIYKPENNKSCMTFLKIILIIFNIIIWLFGAALVGLGVVMKTDKAFWEIQTGLNMTQFNTACYIIIAVGVIIMLIAFAGCYGAMALNLCLLITYSIIIILIILMEIAIMALVWMTANNKDLKEDLKGKVKSFIQDMARDDNHRMLLDLIQTKLECCGIDSPDDYTGPEGSPDPLPIPNSCTNPDTGFPFERGCMNVAVEYFKSKAGILGGVAISVFILQILALIITICLVCGIKHSATNLVF